jgi:hypothetical protein
MIPPPPFIGSPEAQPAGLYRRLRRTDHNGHDEAALVRLWREKRAQAESPNYSDSLVVQLGVAPRL